MNRSIRRELAKREINRKKTTLPKEYTLSDLTRKNEIDLGRARRDGRIEGMDRMYQLVMTVLDKTTGIGAKRREQIRLGIINEIIEIGKQTGVIVDGLLDAAETGIGAN